MKICMIGLGSIGKRHLENLTAVLKKHEMNYQIDAVRSSRTKLQEKWSNMICRQYYNIDELPNDFDIIFVTNPTFLHYDTIRSAIDKTKHMFIEKPVFDNLKYDINSLPLKKDSVYYVACPLRHKSIINYIKDTIVENQKIISARIISTSYLPGWRKDVDYRTIYSAKDDMGGGVSRDLIHEWDYAKYLFGNPSQVFHMKAHFSDLEIDSDDISVYLAKYPKMFLEMHLDYIGHKTERILQMFTNSKRIDVDLLSDVIYEYEDNELILKKEFPKEDFYLNEMEYFMDCIARRQDNMNTIADAYDTLKVAVKKE